MACLWQKHRSGYLSSWPLVEPEHSEHEMNPETSTFCKSGLTGRISFSLVPRHKFARTDSRMSETIGDALCLFDCTRRCWTSPRVGKLPGRYRHKGFRASIDFAFLQTGVFTPVPPRAASAEKGDCCARTTQHVFANSKAAGLSRCEDEDEDVRLPSSGKEMC
jgi:hypothetical protein